MHLSDFRALSFDCYGTIIDWDAGIAAVLAPWAAEHGLHLTKEQLLAAYAEHEAKTESENPTDLYPTIIAKSFVRMGAELGAPVSGDDQERLATSVPDWPIFPDSIEALKLLGTYFKLIILSNIDDSTFKQTNAKLGIEFDAVLTAQQIGSYKPSPRNFHALLDHLPGLGVERAQLIHVAESLFHDHVPAQRMGLRTVRILRARQAYGWGATPRPAVDVQPDWEFPSLAAMGEARAAESTP